MTNRTPAMGRIRISMICLLTMLLAWPAVAADLYVSPTGNANAPGTRQRPTTLQAAAKRNLSPGDTVYMLGGTYKMTPQQVPTIQWKGRENARITLRSAPDQWAVIDGRLDIDGANYVTLRDFEMTRTADVNVNDPNWWNLPVRERPTYSGGGTLKFAMGGSLIEARQSQGLHLINLYLHDNVSGNGVGLWNPALNTYMYGCLMIRNGWDDKGRGHGHGAYIQNGWPEDRFGNSKKVFKHNITAFNYASGMKSYGETPAVRSTHFFENIFYANGMLSWTNGSANYLIGIGRNYAEDIVLTGNHFYQPPQTTGDVGGTVYLGWGNDQKRDLIFTDNHVIGGGLAAVRLQHWQKLTFTGNTLYDDAMLIHARAAEDRLKAWTVDNNTYYLGQSAPPIELNGQKLTLEQWRQKTGFDRRSQTHNRPPTPVQIHIFPNEHDPDRAHIAVYNWDNRPHVELDLSGFIKTGDRYLIFSALDYRGKPVAEGSYTSGLIRVEMPQDKVIDRVFSALVIHVQRDRGRGRR